MKSTLLAALMLLLDGCGMCSDEIITQVRSPDGRYDAVVLVRGCGATTSDVTRIHLEERRWLLPNSVELIAVGHYRPPEMRVSWMADRRLLIECARCDQWLKPRTLRPGDITVALEDDHLGEVPWLTWALDFMPDALATGGGIRHLTIVDGFPANARQSKRRRVCPAPGRQGCSTGCYLPRSRSRC